MLLVCMSLLTLTMCHVRFIILDRYGYETYNQRLDINVSLHSCRLDVVSTPGSALELEYHLGRGHGAEVTLSTNLTDSTARWHFAGLTIGALGALPCLATVRVGEEYTLGTLSIQADSGSSVVGHDFNMNGTLHVVGG